MSTTSFQPALVRWYRTLQPTTPPPMTTARACDFMKREPLIVPGRAGGRESASCEPQRHVANVAMDRSHCTGISCQTVAWRFAYKVRATFRGVPVVIGEVVESR